MDHQDNGYVSPEALIDGREEDVSISMGTVRIRRLGVAELIEARGALIDIAAMASARDDEPDVKKVTPERVRAMARIVQRGLVAPALFANPSEGPTPDDLPFQDLALLFQRIMALSGASRKAGEELRPS